MKFLLAFSVLLMVSIAHAQVPDLTGFLIDYKFWYIKRDDKGKIFEAAVRFYAGKITTEDEFDPVLGTTPVTRYRRTQRIQEFPVQVQGSIATDKNGNAILIFTPKQFGVISTDDQLRAFLNLKLASLALATNATVIDEQK